MSLSDVVQAYIDSNQAGIGMLYTFLFIPVAAYAYQRLIANRDWYILKLGIKGIKREADVEYFSNLLIEMIENREQPDCRIILEGALKSHIKYSLKQTDIDLCNVILTDNLKDEETPAKLKRWYLFVLLIIAEGLEKFPKSARLHLLNAFTN